MDISDYESRDSFTPFEVEDLLGIPLSDIAELFAKVPRAQRGCYQGPPARALIDKFARKRILADLIARSAVNAAPEIKKAPDQPEDGTVAVIDVEREHRFVLRFPGELRQYLESRAEKV